MTNYEKYFGNTLIAAATLSYGCYITQFAKWVQGDCPFEIDETMTSEELLGMWLESEVQE